MEVEISDFFNLSPCIAFPPKVLVLFPEWRDTLIYVQSNELSALDPKGVNVTWRVHPTFSTDKNNNLYMHAYIMEGPQQHYKTEKKCSALFTVYFLYFRKVRWGLQRLKYITIFFLPTCSLRLVTLHRIPHTLLFSIQFIASAPSVPISCVKWTGYEIKQEAWVEDNSQVPTWGLGTWWLLPLIHTMKSELEQI